MEKGQNIKQITLHNPQMKIYSVIQKDGLNFVYLHFKIMTSDKCDVI